MRRSHRKGGGQQLEVTIAAMGARGDGLASLSDGTPLFVPYALPGEQVIVRTAARSASGVRADMIELLKASPDRVEAPCPNTAQCGGCILQHWSFAAQSAWKLAQVKAAVRRTGFSPDAVQPLVQPLSSQRRRARFLMQGGKLGFRQRHSKTIAAFGPCMTLNEGLTQFWHAAQHMPKDTPESEWLVTDLPAGFDVSIQSKATTPEPLTLERWRDVLPPLSRIAWNGDMLLELSPPQVELGGLAPVLPIGGFLQPSLGGQSALQEAVLRAIPKDADWIADLYCGLGTFAIPLAARGHRVQALESYVPAVAALDAAVRRDPSNIYRIHVGLRNLDLYPLQGEELTGFDAVVFDPPRAGAKAQAKRLAERKVHTVVVVSCNPATWARDGVLLKEGGYELQSLIPVDQFSNTSHLELVSTFRRWA